MPSDRKLAEQGVSIEDTGGQTTWRFDLKHMGSWHHQHHLGTGIIQ